MKSKIKQMVKANKKIYSLYFYIGSFFFRLLGYFIKTDDNLVLYVVYGGQRYDDSPRFIYEYLMKNRKNSKYKKLKHVWAFDDLNQMKKENVPVDNMVKIDSFQYYISALKAKYWITNSSASRGLDFKKKKTINIMFQHGTAGIKMIGADLKQNNESFGNAFNEKFDYIFIEGKQEEEILKRAWKLHDFEFTNIGLPRNDDLVNKDFNDVANLKIKLGIPLNKKVILYAPTYREYNKDSSCAIFLKPPIDFDKWFSVLGNEYILLLTAHYEVAKLMNIPKTHPFVINAFKYPYINDLILVSDILISDYSSIIFDYSIVGRPIISYAYDYDAYKNERGIYPGYEQIFSHGIMKCEDEVINYLHSLSSEEYKKECDYTCNNIRDKYISNYGNSTEKSVKIIFGS